MASTRCTLQPRAGKNLRSVTRDGHSEEYKTTVVGISPMGENVVNEADRMLHVASEHAIFEVEGTAQKRRNDLTGDG